MVEAPATAKVSLKAGADERGNPAAERQTSPRAQASSNPTTPKPKGLPNLIVDIAETCEEVFPFDEMAKKHKVPRQKVVDIFSAIVQVPLLRCATDKRRTGKLAQLRMKEHAKARRDLEAENGSTYQGSKSVAAGDVAATISRELARLMPPVDIPAQLCGLSESQ
jgi:hypothetical protein